MGEGLDKEEAGPTVFLLESEVPHDWLFPHCSAVVHHGGSGTTAAGLRAGAHFTQPLFDRVRQCDVCM